MTTRSLSPNASATAVATISPSTVPTARRASRRYVSSRSGRITKRIVSGIQKPWLSMSKAR